MFRLSLIVIVFFTTPLWGKNYIDVVVEKTSELKNKGTAKQKMRTEAIEEIAVKYVKELIGEEKYNQNLQLIQVSILNNKGKFIPYVKTSDFEKNEVSGFNMNVSIKLSIDDLKQVLLNHGMLYKLSGQPKIITYVEVEDQINSKNLIWWAQKKESYDSFLGEILKHINSKLKDVFAQHNFYQILPVQQSYIESMPDIFKQENLRKDELIVLSDFFNAQIMIIGKILISERKSVSDTYRIQMKLKAVQTGNGRIIGEIARKYETDLGSFKSVVQKKMIEASELVAKDLSIQVLEAWQKGTFGANLLKLTVNGRWKYDQVKIFKSGLEKLKMVKGLRERVFSPESVTFELDVPMGARQFSKEIENKSIQGFQFVVSKVEDDRVVVDTKLVP